MRKTILTLACLLLGLVPNMAQQRKIADVQHLADSILNRPTRFGKRVKTIRTQRIIAASELRNAQQNGFYICEAGDDGYAVISADERMTPVLGFSQGRGFDATNIPAGLQELLDSYTNEYKALVNGESIRPAKRKIDGIKDQVGPLFISQWDQKAPFNNRCPELRGQRCITGCVAISTSQTLYYYQYPDSAKGTVNYVSRTNQIPIQEDLSTFKFNWSDIRSVYNNGATQKEYDAIADLVYCCAVAAQMDFGIKESAASSVNQVKAFVENFGYDTDIACLDKNCMPNNEWQELMLNELNNERPIVYSAVAPSSGGHSFIIDGYKADEDGYPFYHVNWGWGGSYDDFFKLSALEADGDEYSQNHEAIIGIEPDNGIRDTENFWQAKEVVLSSARINPNETHKFNITLNNLFNKSYKTFRGKLDFYLEDANHKETQIATQNLNNVPFNYGLSTLNVEATLPMDIAEGDYTLIIRSKADGSDKYEDVTHPTPLSLTVTTITESYTPNMQVNDLINLGEGLSGLSVSLRATLPRNGAAKTFTGWLKLAVADEKGNILQHFGKVYYISSLEQGYYQPYAVTFEGQLPEYMEDGAYRLYLVANQSGYLEWGKVSQFKMEAGGIVEGTEIFIPFWLEDGKILYHKESEEDLPEFYANIQATEMQITGFDPITRHINMHMSNVINMGNESFIGQFSMVVYDQTDKLITVFGEPQRISTVLEHYSMIANKSFDFSGHLPNELEDGNYIVKIAAKQNGCQGWSPIKGWAMDGNFIVKRNEELSFGFHILNNKMYKEDADGLLAPVDNIKECPVYNLNGQKISSRLSTLNSLQRKGIYIVGNRKVVK